EEICDGGSCECKPGLSDCNGQCVQLENDPNNCGMCGNDCGQESCGNGMCLPNCDQFPDECDGMCTDLETDPLNCGGCGEACNNDELCINGNCREFLANWEIMCNMCPCNDCSGDFDQCCDVDGYGVVCVDANQCP
ncbi:MAG: hypothetical protein KC457_36770, partial [Myxococcales bacterium]|nr:hypothetical protein [Myxococcales bacterium]